MYVKIENGVVVQKQPNKGDGFIEAPDDVVCGMLYDGESFTNPPEPAPTLDDIRNKRDLLIEEVEWRFTRHASEKRQGLTPTDDIEKLDEYVQALRDLPQNFENPEDVIYPDKP